MILPASHAAELVLLAVSILCWGTWANLLKLSAPRWRFELFYYDFSLGTLLLAALAAFTLGSFNSKELTFQDNLLIVGYRNMGLAVAAGIVFNLANMLLSAAISVTGMAIPFILAMGLALAIDTGLNDLLNLRGDPLLLILGAVLAFVASIIALIAYIARPTLSKSPSPRTKAPRASRAKGALLALAGGIIMATFYPLLRFGAWEGSPLSPYGTALFFSIGVWLSTFLYNPFFMFFPVQGSPIEIKRYFSGRVRQHFLGIFAGMLWMVGGLANFMIAGSYLAAYQWGQIAVLLSAVAGLLAWREFAGSNAKAKLLITAAVVIFGGALAALVAGYSK